MRQKLIYGILFFCVIWLIGERFASKKASQSANNDWKGYSTGIKCHSHKECTTCTKIPNTDYSAMLCMCLPELKECGYGPYQWKNSPGR